MRKWDIEPAQVAAMAVEQFPFEAEQIALDFLEGAAKANNESSILFWTTVLNLVGHMQMKLADDPGYLPELRFGAAM